MPVYGNQQSIGANADSNVLNGRRIENVPLGAAAAMTFLETASATGMESEVFIGDTAIKERGGCNLLNRVPIIEDTFAVGVLAAPGSRITWTYYNTTGGALTAFYRLEQELLDPRRV